MSGHFVSDFPDSGSVDYSDQSTNLDETAIAELNELAGRYPHPRSALLPMLHLVQSYDGRISPRGIELCAEILGITTAQVSGVATFYTMFKRRPAGHHHLGVCTTALCAPCGRVSLERLECNAACDYAPVAMVNWEFFDDMTPEKLDELIDALMNGDEVVSPRGATITSWKKAERVLAGFPDGRADEGPSAGHASTLGRRIAAEKGWSAPDPGDLPAAPEEETK